jgi:hypothetical protein
MTLESGRKLGLISSLINVFLPVVAIVGVIVFIFSAIATAVTGSGAAAAGLSVGLIGFIVVLAIVALLGLSCLW